MHVESTYFKWSWCGFSRGSCSGRPVDDFSQMVVEMSKSVQFLVVTHNKVTMEAARQLCGVTMREAGVSRLVQVDLAEALLTQAPGGPPD